MKKRKSAVIFGAGDMCKHIMPAINNDLLDVLAIVDDSAPVGNNKISFGKPVIRLDDIVNFHLDYIFIACRVSNDHIYQSINKKFKSYTPQIISLDFEDILFSNKENSKNIRCYEHKLNNYLQTFCVQEYFDIQKLIYSAWLRKIVYNEHNFHDHLRHMNAYILSYEIITKNIQGSIAEFGVYKGDFSIFLHELFPNKTIYLFDTFEGFVESQHDNDIENYKIGYESFSDTSEEFVRNRFSSDQCIIKKGVFPDSARDITDEFCFVSIDVDLYQPTMDGLSFFWSRLVSGGYIMIHDYGYLPYSGCRKAVQDFCRQRKIPYTPICDWAISAVLAKP